MIGIRVDANQTIATGHIKRDITVALCLRQLGQECVFISADEECSPYIAAHHFQGIVLGTRWDDMESELGSLKKIIEAYDITSLLVDSYSVTEGYMKQLKEWVRVTYFDELGYLGFGCQQLINGVLEPQDYSGYLGRALLGPDYVPLRAEFQCLPPKKVGPELNRILITSGGTDNYHFCAGFLQYILENPRWKHLRISAVIGELSEDKEVLAKTYEDVDRVTLYVNTDCMSKLMQEADYIVTAGGMTLYEVCAVGTMASCYAIADNQVENAKSFDRKGLVHYAGDFRYEPENTMAAIEANMEYACHQNVRENQAVRMQRLVDGKGALRIAEALADLSSMAGSDCDMHWD